MLFFILGFYYMHYKGLIGGGLFCVFTICFVLLVILDIVKRRKSGKKELTNKVLESEGGNTDSDSGHVSHTVEVRPTLAGMCCDMFALIMLIIAWIVIFRNNLLDIGESRGVYVILLYSMATVVCLVVNYLPRTYGGMYQLLGMKQVKQDIFRLHAAAFVSALTVLSCSLRYILPSNPVITVLLGVSAVGVVVLFFCKFFIKKVTPTQEDIEKLLRE